MILTLSYYSPTFSSIWSSLADISLANKNKVGKLIAEAIHRSEIKEEEVFYRVVCGSYSKKENAAAQIELLKSKGINNDFIDVYKK